MTIIDSTKKGKIIEEHFSDMNIEPWIYIYEKFVNIDFEQKDKEYSDDDEDDE